MRALNTAGRLAPGAITPSADAWWSGARTGEPEAGEPAPEARAASAALAESLREDARLSLVGRFTARDEGVRLGATHLRTQRALREQPEIAHVKLPDPIFVIGWPRSGTTFLHRLLGTDPDTRTIPYWESFDPVPPRSGPDRRAAQVERLLARLEQIAPAYQAIHPMRADDTEECVALFTNDFRTLQLDIQYRVPGYVRWLLAQDARVAYQGYFRQLQLIHHHRPHGARFVLKDPTHLVHLEAVVALFPDAKLVFTHRDPAFAISSICSLYAHTRALLSDDVDARAIGAEVMDGYWPAAMERAQALRDQLDPARCIDVRHADVARDPIGAAAALYAALGLELTDAARAAMREYVARDAAAHGEHAHAPEGFGLRGEEIRERFAGYVARFEL
ncbi:MAG TPA: sulfotransferase [Myxococcota bacterium]|nr:sulfotransferase [Myxococcota bacterium]